MGWVGVRHELTRVANAALDKVHLGVEELLQLGIQVRQGRRGLVCDTNVRSAVLLHQVLDQVAGASSIVIRSHPKNKPFAALVFITSNSPFSQITICSVCTYFRTFTYTHTHTHTHTPMYTDRKTHAHMCAILFVQKPIEQAQEQKHANEKNTHAHKYVQAHATHK